MLVQGKMSIYIFRTDILCRNYTCNSVISPFEHIMPFYTPLKKTQGRPTNGRPYFHTTSSHPIVTAASGNLSAAGDLAAVPFFPFPFSSTSLRGLVNPLGGL